MIDQLRISDKYSYDDFGASVSQRETEYPEKKSIRETVPFSNITYDFSAINGEVYWQERTLKYVFELTANSPEELEDAKTEFANWIMNVFEENIHDPFIPDYHFVGTFEKIATEDDEGLDKTTLTVTFKAYPFKIANNPKHYDAKITAHGSASVAVRNDSAHRVMPTIESDQPIIFVIGNSRYAIPAGKTEDATLTFERGLTSFIIENGNDSECSVAISFCEEVL